MPRLPVRRRVTAAAAALLVFASLAGCGASGGGADSAGDSRNVSAVVAAAPVGEGGRGAQDVRLAVTDLDSVRGPVSVFFNRGATDVPCANPRVTARAAADAASGAIVCTLPEGTLPEGGDSGATCRPGDFRVCGDNGCGPVVAERWYFTSAPADRP